MRKIRFISVVGVSFVVGYALGERMMQGKVSRKLGEIDNLRTRGIANAIMRARDENMTEEELLAELRSELDFVQIVTR